MSPLVSVWLASIVGAICFFVAGFVTARRSMTRRQRAVRIPDNIGTADALQRILEQVVDIDGCEAAALADDLGLPIAAVGAESGSLSAFSGFMCGIAAKSSELLSMDQPRRVEVVDVSGRTVSACPIRLAESEISLVTLTDGPGPDAQSMDQILHTAGSVIQ
jgi:predicted regulator of Ras-like GTPase activity (Roadblock/LC7/MglB family)